MLQSIAIYRPLASSSCVRCIIYGVLGHGCSKASLFTGFWLAWVGKPRFFAHQMASHIDPARSAAELRSMHYLRRFGQILLQSLAIYRLLASSGCVRCIIYGVLGHGCSKASLFTGFCLAWVGKPRSCYAQALGIHLKSRNRLLFLLPFASSSNAICFRSDYV